MPPDFLASGRKQPCATPPRPALIIALITALIADLIAALITALIADLNPALK
jgi:hypothetical protein